MKNILHCVEKILGIYRWHPKIALRYLPIVDYINKLSSNYSILEIGSGGLGIAPYLKKRIVGIDTNFDLPIDENLIAVKSTALDIPFPEKSFDIVVCMDVLEHIPPEERKNLIHQILKTAGKQVFLGVPIGNLSAKQDEEISSIYLKNNKDEFCYLKQHIKYGLPETKWLIDTINMEAKNLRISIKIQIQGNINLKFRKWLMLGWLSKNKLVNIIFRKVFILFIPIFRLFNQPPVYRQLFFITIH